MIDVVEQVNKNKFVSNNMWKKKILIEIMIWL